jgi:hypothetical protein
VHVTVQLAPAQELATEVHPTMAVVPAGQRALQAPLARE